MYPYINSSPISFIKILGGLSKGIGIIKELLPVYEQFKPLIEKAPAFLSNLNDIRNKVYLNLPNKSISYNEDAINNTYNNGPTFFK